MPARPLGLPESRSASGTSWQPDSTPMYALHAMTGDWTFMVHGNVFAGYDVQGSHRGGQRFVSQNWLMAMARHSNADLEIEGRVMLSAEPFTLGGPGYPLLLQTGETYRGARLHDAQHPHDFFMETSLTLIAAVGPALGLELYVAPAGEPALGPPGFPHRASAASNPLAPLGHHWQDSSHITYGVLTAGLFTRQVKLEGSWFNGREPDERRYDFDLRVPDSFAARLSINPAPQLGMQVSYGFLKSPEAIEPQVSVHRATASVSLDVPLGDGGSWATTAIWGENLPAGGPATAAYLLESEIDVGGHDIVLGRAEYTQKTGEELVLPATEARRTFDVGSLTLGYVRELGPVASLLPGFGVVGTLNVIGGDLGRSYGTTLPAGAMVFVRLRPAEMKMDPMEGRQPMMRHHPR